MNAPLLNPIVDDDLHRPRFSVIVSAYNNFEALIRALPFWQAQSSQQFEMIIADDGSSRLQRDQFRKAAQKTHLSITHIWHEDKGFDKCGILNKAILTASAERLLFVDADMIPRFDLVENHLRLLKRRRFISGGSHVNINFDGQEFLKTWRPQDAKLIFNQHSKVATDFVARTKSSRLSRYGFDARVSDLLTWRTNAFSGANASCWKTDALAVNGFDEAWGYGGLDRDFGIRLTNSGVDSRRHQFSLVALHQDHPRPYKEAAQVAQNKKMLIQRLRNRVTWVDHGIDQHRPESIEVLWSQR